MDAHDNDLSFGVFKPVGHVVVSFPNAAAADRAAQALAQMGVRGGLVRRYSDRHMLAQIDRDIERASPLASVGQEMNLIKAQRELAERGFHFLVVKADDDEQAAAVAACVKPFGAERAQHYGHFIIDELIEPPGLPQQVAESPDRGLDRKP